MIKNKLFVILATVVLLIMAACEGGFVEPGTLSSISGPNSGLTGGGVTGAGSPALGGGGGSGGIGGIGGGSSGDGSGGIGSGSGGGSGGTGGGGYAPATSGQLTINGIPDKYNGKYAKAIHDNIGEYGVMLFALQGETDKGEDISAQISGGSVTLKVWRYTVSNGLTSYSGNDKNVLFDIFIYNKASGDYSSISLEGYHNPTVVVDFTNGKAIGTYEKP